MHLIANFFEELDAAQDDLVDIHGHEETDFRLALGIESLEGQEDSEGSENILWGVIS